VTDARARRRGSREPPTAEGEVQRLHNGEVAADVPIVAVVGPTAAGKSELAVALAVELDGEVVNGDSMQLYRGMDIGTAKVATGQRRGVPHHVLDVLHVGEPATVAEFQGWAREALSDCRARGRTPVLVGGSALYMRAVIDEFEFPGTDADIRAELETDLDRMGAAALHARLAAIDPDAASTILPTNGRRIVRALEVITLTGKPFSASLPDHVYAFDDVVQIGIDIPRDVLDSRIVARVHGMWDSGFVDEVRRLERDGLRDGRTASRALGYRQVLEFLAGDRSEDEAQEATIRATRRFARRQDSWFKRDRRIVWLRWDDDDLLGHALDAVRSRA
jgi:tRNA dimethylallyltransferase